MRPGLHETDILSFDCLSTVLGLLERYHPGAVWWSKLQEKPRLLQLSGWLVRCLMRRRAYCREGRGWMGASGGVGYS